MIDTVFISDLHLNPDEPQITERFKQFVNWAMDEVQTLYILGDFFHLWAGDDTCGDFEKEIASWIRKLVDAGKTVFYIRGNRDFLLSSQFQALTGWVVLDDPLVIELGDTRVLITHGDQYCLLDKGHQRLRKLTRNALFPWLFQKIPLKFRLNIVNRVRMKSLNKTFNSMAMMDVVEQACIEDMQTHAVTLMIHGHTHRTGKYPCQVGENLYTRYVLSDWDDNPHILCYDVTSGIYFKQIAESGS